MIYWELLRKQGDSYKVIDTAETSEYDPRIPKFKEEQVGDIILGRKDDGLEAYLVE